MPPILKVSNFTATFLGFKGVKSAVTYTILIFVYISKCLSENELMVKSCLNFTSITWLKNGQDSIFWALRVSTLIA